MSSHIVVFSLKRADKISRCNYFCLPCHFCSALRGQLGLLAVVPIQRVCRRGAHIRDKALRWFQRETVRHRELAAVSRDWESSSGCRWRGLWLGMILDNRFVWTPHPLSLNKILKELVPCCICYIKSRYGVLYFWDFLPLSTSNGMLSSPLEVKRTCAVSAINDTPV